MTRMLTILFASTALTAALGLPAWSAMHASAQQEGAVVSAMQTDAAGDEVRLIFVDDDDEGDDDRHDDDDDDDDDDYGDDDDDDDCEDDDGNCGARAAAPAPAGSAAPPQNGLFGTGTPQVQVQ